MEPHYAINRALGFGHIDNRGVSRPSALFDLMQDAATEHAYALGLSREALGVVWVLSRMKAQQERPFFPGEPLRIETALRGVRGASFCRSFAVWGEDGASLARATSTWVMLSSADHRILRPKDVPAAAQLTAAPVAFDMPGKLTCAALRPHHVRAVRYSDLDINNHLNNVKTVDLIADGLALDERDGLFVSALQVNYTAECRCGEEIEISLGAGEDGTSYVFGQTKTASKFEAAARLSPYEGKV